MQVQARRVPRGIDIQVFYYGQRYGGVVTPDQLRRFLEQGLDIPPWLESFTIGPTTIEVYILRNEMYNEKDEDLVEAVLPDEDLLLLRGKLSRVYRSLVQ